MADELSKALRAQWTPAMKSLGFSTPRARSYVRRIGDVLHHVWFQVNACGSRDFVPTVSVGLLFTERGWSTWRFSHANGADAWLKSETEEQAKASCQTAWGMFVQRVLPDLNACTKPRDISFMVSSESRPTNPDALFVAGLVDALDGRESATSSLQRATEEYEAWGAPWTVECARRAQLAISACRNGHVNELLDGWRQEGLTKFKLA